MSGHVVETGGDVGEGDRCVAQQTGASSAQLVRVTDKKLLGFFADIFRYVYRSSIFEIEKNAVKRSFKCDEVVFDSNQSMPEDDRLAANFFKTGPQGYHLTRRDLGLEIAFGANHDK